MIMSNLRSMTKLSGKLRYSPYGKLIRAAYRFSQVLKHLNAILTSVNLENNSTVSAAMFFFVVVFLPRTYTYLRRVIFRMSSCKQNNTQQNKKDCSVSFRKQTRKILSIVKGICSFCIFSCVFFCAKNKIMNFFVCLFVRLSSIYFSVSSIIILLLLLLFKNI